jgi:uncharacterized membrane protein YdjX (TVP38/TMEM64 family)
MDKNKKNLLKYLISVILIVVIVFLVIKYRRYLIHINLRELKRYILSYGEFASLIFIVIYSLKPILLVVPTGLLSILAGNIFGPQKALLMSMIGCFGSGTVAFFLARFLGRSFVDKFLKGKAMALDSNIEKHGFKIMLLMRLAVVFPYDPLSYAAGLTKMKYRDFILGTLIGVLPEMVTYSLMGKNMHHPFSHKFILPIVIVIAVAIVASYVYKKSINGKNS